MHSIATDDGARQLQDAADPVARALSAASAASAVAMELVEAVRHRRNIAAHVGCVDTTDGLAAALETILQFELDSGPCRRVAEVEQLLAAVTRFLGEDA